MPSAPRPILQGFESRRGVARVVDIPHFHNFHLAISHASTSPPRPGPAVDANLQPANAELGMLRSAQLGRMQLETRRWCAVSGVGSQGLAGEMPLLEPVEARSPAPE